MSLQKIANLPNLVNGMLPPGIHTCPMEILEQTFGKSSISTRRADLWSKFASYINWLRRIKFFTEIYVDGSFTSEKIDPSDIDVILVAPNPTSENRVRFNNEIDIQKALNVSYAKASFEVHSFIWYQGIPPEKDLIDFFQSIRVEEAKKLNLPSGYRKGIVRVTL